MLKGGWGGERGGGVPIMKMKIFILQPQHSCKIWFCEPWNLVSIQSCHMQSRVILETIQSVLNHCWGLDSINNYCCPPPTTYNGRHQHSGQSLHVICWIKTFIKAAYCAVATAHAQMCCSRQTRWPLASVYYSVHVTHRSTPDQSEQRLSYCGYECQP